MVEGLPNTVSVIVAQHVDTLNFERVRRLRFGLCVCSIELEVTHDVPVYLGNVEERFRVAEFPGELIF